MGIYQLCFLKMHSRMLFLAEQAESMEKAVVARALADVLSEASEIMRRRNFVFSPFRMRIIGLAAGASAALACLEEDGNEPACEPLRAALVSAAQ